MTRKEQLKWQRRVGITKRDRNYAVNAFPNLKCESPYSLSDDIGNGIRRKEGPKSSAIAPLYNKGAYQLITPKTDLTTLG